jgi:formylglycine-generating enzyme required for sulfatase activity
VTHRLLLLVGNLLPVLALAGGCWDLANPYDPLRCGGGCGTGQYCFQGQCVAWIDGSPEARPSDFRLEAHDGFPDAHVSFVMVPPSGTSVPVTFAMGSPGSTSAECGCGTDEIQHNVKLTHRFEMLDHEVTQSEYQSITGGKSPSYFSCSNCPVEQITWDEAAAFCNALSASHGFDLCYKCSDDGGTGCTPVNSFYDCTGYRLPTEAEWEYAYRAGTTTAFYFGAISDGCHSCAEGSPGKYSWFYCNADYKTHDVKGKLANNWHLYDMAGNVWEYCNDLYQQKLADETDPMGATTGTVHIVRGGSWSNLSGSLRAAMRGQYQSSDKNQYGFRYVRTLSKK